MIEITYLLNSGFLVRVGRTLLVFDDFKDPAGAVDAAVEAADFDHLYFFASHGHFDHFDAHICAYEAKTERYILSDDIRCTKALSSFDQAKLVFLKTYASWQDEHIAVESFDSTDIGTSFRAVLKDEGVTLFHAGDFNWWDWTGEPQEQRKLAENAFRKQMKKLKGLEADLAFFPVDAAWARASTRAQRCSAPRRRCARSSRCTPSAIQPGSRQRAFSEQAVPFPSGRRARRARRPASKMANSSQTDGRLLKT